MFENLSVFVLAVIFIGCSAAIWIAGIKITKAIDFITKHFNLGEAFGGMVFLAVVTNLPEIAITCVAAYHHHMDIAVSNILGGIAIQTVVLVLIDAFGVGRSAPLTYKEHSPILVLEGVSLIFILTIVMMGKQFSPDLIFFRMTPFEILILAIWLGSIYLLSNMQKQTKGKTAEPAKEKPLSKNKKTPFANIQMALLVFIVCAVVTLFSGWALEASGELLAKASGMSGVLFGATILALSTALPEISTGIASAKIKDYQMAVSDIFGGNAFLPVLFLVASLISGDAILPSLQPSDMYLTGLGILLTGIYMIGLVLGSKRQYFRLGIDSILVVIIYALGIIGLLYLT